MNDNIDRNFITYSEVETCSSTLRTTRKSESTRMILWTAKRTAWDESKLYSDSFAVRNDNLKTSSSITNLKTHA